MSNLRTNYKDDVFTGSRKYHMNNNGDGTVSFTDETPYIQNGDTYGAAQINEANDIINNLDNNTYKSTDAAMTDIADNDYIPIYDTSASAKKKTLWSNIKSLFTQTFAIKVHDSNSAGTYGAGTSSRFGHVKLSDSYDNVSPGSSSQSVGASEAAVCNAYGTLANNIQGVSSRLGTSISVVDASLVANNNHFYFDYHDGKYGYNTSSRRGADTFRPFNSASILFPFSITVQAFISQGEGTVYPCAKLNGYRLMTSGISTIKITFSSDGVDVGGTRSLAVKNPSGVTISTAFDSNISVVEYDYVIVDYTSGSWGDETTDTVTFSQVN